MFKSTVKTAKAFANSGFARVAALVGKDRSELRTYWTELYGSEYAGDMVRDYETGGKKQDAKA